MTMSHEERTLIARSAMLNTESEAFVAAYNERVADFMKDCPPQRLDQLGRDYPEECTSIINAIPTAAQLTNLDIILNELRGFSDLPSEDRGFIALAYMQLHEARRLFLLAFFIRAQQEAAEASYRLHWVAKERKRNAQRSAHRMASPDRLEDLDKVSRHVDIWAKRLHKPSKVVA